MEASTVPHVDASEALATGSWQLDIRFILENCCQELTLVSPMLLMIKLHVQKKSDRWRERERLANNLSPMCTSFFPKLHQISNPQLGIWLLPPNHAIDPLKSSQPTQLPYVLTNKK